MKKIILSIITLNFFTTQVSYATGLGCDTLATIKERKQCNIFVSLGLQGVMGTAGAIGAMGIMAKFAKNKVTQVEAQKLALEKSLNDLRAVSPHARPEYLQNEIENIKKNRPQFIEKALAELKATNPSLSQEELAKWEKALGDSYENRLRYFEKQKNISDAKTEEVQQNIIALESGKGYRAIRYFSNKAKFFIWLKVIQNLALAGAEAGTAYFSEDGNALSHKAVQYYQGHKEKMKETAHALWNRASDKTEQSTVFSAK